jgi:hypothetical protein
MEIPLRKEVLKILSDLKISLIDSNHQFVGEYYKCCSRLRTHLLNKESGQALFPLSGGSFWDITPKFRVDVLGIDIHTIANQLAYSIGFSSLYLNQVAKIQTQYSPTMADYFFWYHIDFGIRLASSGWDRIALLLDLAFELNSGKDCNLSLVLRNIPKVNPQIIQDVNFKKLKAFRDSRFLDLEAGAGKGARHETTHLISPSTRLLFEFLDTHAGMPGKIPPELRPKERLDMLIEHHGFYLSGVQDTLRLISLRWL